jgi:D-alanyl-D-alanine dipeptidase
MCGCAASNAPFDAGGNEHSEPADAPSAFHSEDPTKSPIASSSSEPAHAAIPADAKEPAHASNPAAAATPYNHPKQSEEIDSMKDIAANATLASQEPPEKVKIAPTRALKDVFDYNGLVDLMEIDPTFDLDIRYATENNFTRTVHYPFPMALMQKEAAAMLLKAQKIANEDGFKIRIYDAYRPLSVQRSLYEATPPQLKAFVAKPSKTAKHSIGISIDCGLSDMDGNELDMPSEFDDFSEKAYGDYIGGTAEQEKNRAYLINLMESCGFAPLSIEWWHFNAPNPKGISAMDISFEEFQFLRDEFYKSW